MPDISRATRLANLLADDLKRKRKWSEERPEPPFGMKRVDPGDLLRAFRKAPELEKQRLLKANGSRGLLDAMQRERGGRDAEA